MEELEGKSIGKRYTTDYPDYPLKKATEIDIRIERTCQVFSTEKEKRACERGFREGALYSVEILRYIMKGIKEID